MVVKFKNTSKTRGSVMVLRVTVDNTAEKIIHISVDSRLIKLANFIFHIYNEQPEEVPFEFKYESDEAKSYGDHRRFRLQPGRTPLPPGVGNIRTSRVDSAFFFTSLMLLEVKTSPPRRYRIEFLYCEPPDPNREYPCMSRAKRQLRGKQGEEKWYSDPAKAPPSRCRLRVMAFDEVSISREGEIADITYLDGSGGRIFLRVDGDLRSMSDLEVLTQHNEVAIAQEILKNSYQHRPVEVPVGKPQIVHYARGSQWVPRGDVLRCVISDGGPDGEAVVIIDDQELSLEEFGKLLVVYTGWGMRMTFVPEDETHEHHPIEIRDPKDGD